MTLRLNATKGSETAPPSSLARHQQLFIIGVFILLFSLGFFIQIGETADEEQKKEASKIVLKEKKCSIDCVAQSKSLIEEFGGDLKDRKVLLERATEARDRVVESIKQDYGTYFDAIFRDIDGSRFGGFRPISSDESLARLKRKLKIKALTVQERIKRQEDLCENHCLPLDQIEANPIFQSSKFTNFARYVWATGGHSASAGHGNLYNESYTAFMERDLSPIFAAIGIEFEGRNYAMGGTSSGLEISMCYEEIFGSDVDFSSWDYGMTDGRKGALLFHYGYRGALTTRHLAILGVWTNGWSGREVRLRDLENIGLASFFRTDNFMKSVYQAFPDSGIVEEKEIQAMPKYVQNFKCNDQIEKGEPYCRTAKYTSFACPKRTAQVSWHPGFKAHALDGHFLALFLSQVLLDALEELVNHPNQDSKKLLEELQAEEEEAYQAFKAAKLPQDAYQIYQGKEQIQDFDLELFYRGKSICHTGRLPAMSRFLGYVTNSEKKFGIAPHKQEKYDVGINYQDDALKTDANGVMRLAYDPSDKNRQDCQVPLSPDTNDFFFTHNKDGLVKMKVPNEKEKIGYKYNQSEMKGLIVMFLVKCPWGNCKSGDLKGEAVQNGEVNIFINNVQVSSMTTLNDACFVLKHKDGAYWKPSAEDDYEIAVEVLRENSYFRISSIVLF